MHNSCSSKINKALASCFNEASIEVKQSNLINCNSPDALLY